MKTIKKLALITAVLCTSVTFSFAQLTTSTGQTANTLVANLLGPGVTYSNATLVSPGSSSGLFSTGSTPTNIGLVQGVLLTTGSVTNAIGPNSSGSTTTNNSAAGDADLNAIISGTGDACVLQFDFIPQSASISFNYVFASEEYPEFFCSSFNDVFAFLLSGPNPSGGAYVKQNIAVVPGSSDFVLINNVGPGLCNGIDNSSEYVSNAAGATIEYDGFTKVFAATASVVPGQTYTIKLAIADVGDRSWDSGVLLETGSFSSSSLSISPLNASVLQGTQHCVTATVLDAANAPVVNEAVTFQVSGSNTVSSVVVNTDANGEADFCYTPASAGTDVISATAGCQGCNQVNSNVLVTPGVNPPCQFTNTFGPIWINSIYKAAGASDPHTYYWGLSYGVIAARPKNGVGPYTYQWSSSEGYAIKDDTQKRARLWYPTGPQWVKVEITDVGASCTTTDSIYIDWVDFTCNQPSIWYYELCNVNTNTTSCVQGTVNMRNLVSTGDYVYGPCGNPKTNWGNQSSLFEVNLFPNPSNGQFSYELVSATANNYSISIMDINGRVLYSENVDNDYNHVMKDLDLSHLSAGVYIFQVSDENNSAVKRFVIQ